MNFAQLPVATAAKTICDGVNQTANESGMINDTICSLRLLTISLRLWMIETGGLLHPDIETYIYTLQRKINSSTNGKSKSKMINKSLSCRRRETARRYVTFENLC